MSKTFTYTCMSSSCGYTDFTTFAPASTKRCPKCGGTMKRK